jgi:hypothetical protein
MHGRHTQDLAPLLPAQLGADDAVDARADGIAGLVDEDARVIVELDDAAVGSLHLLPRPHHDGVPDVASLHLVRGRGRTHTGVACSPLLLDDGYESVACGEVRTCVSKLCQEGSRDRGVSKRVGSRDEGEFQGISIRSRG